MTLQEVLTRFTYSFKFCVHFLLSCVTFWSVPAIAIAKRRWIDGRNILFGSRLMVIFGKVLGLTAVVGDRFEVDVSENYIVIMNHQSCLDVIILAYIALLLGNLAPIVKKLFAYIQPVGLAITLSGGLLIHKTRGNSAMKALIEKSKDLKTKKRNIVVCPEGTRHDNAELLPFKKGAFCMSIEANMRILPVVVQRYPFLDHKKKIFSRGLVKVEVLQPMEKLEHESVDEFVARTYDLMNTEFKKLNAETTEATKRL